MKEEMITDVAVTNFKRISQNLQGQAVESHRNLSE
jgi:hypothetical protein